MDTPHSSAAQQRVNDIQVFRTELSRLEAAGAVQLSIEQRQAVTAHHEGVLASLAGAFDIDRDTQAGQLSLGMRVTSLLAALALAACVFYLFYQVWGHFSETTQVLILMGAALGSLGLTVWVQGRDASGYFTQLVAGVAVACFILNISMLGQIFNIRPTDQAILPVTALALWLAYACQLRLLLAVGILSVIAYFSAQVGARGGLYWVSMGTRPENYFPVALLLIATPLVVPHRRFAGFDTLYRVFGWLCLLLPLLILSHWGAASYLDMDSERVESLYQVGGFIASAVAIGLGTRLAWNETVNTGIVFFLLFLLTKFFDWWGAVPKWLFFLAIGLCATGVLVVLQHLRRRRVRI